MTLKEDKNNSKGILTVVLNLMEDLKARLDSGKSRMLVLNIRSILSLISNRARSTFCLVVNVDIQNQRSS